MALYSFRYAACVSNALPADKVRTLISRASPSFKLLVLGFSDAIVAVAAFSNDWTFTSVRAILIVIDAVNVKRLRITGNSNLHICGRAVRSAKDCQIGGLLRATSVCSISGLRRA